MADQKQQPPTSIKKFEESTMEGVLQKVTQFEESGSLNLPKDYSVANALRGAWLVLQDQVESKTGTPILQHVTKSSVANAMLDMATQGLNVAKKQGAFVRYGDKLVFQREYFGNIALAKRYAGLKDVHGNVVYDGDTFEIEVDPKTGRKRIAKHTQSLASIDLTKIAGAYAVVNLDDGTSFVEVMNFKQIKQAWMQGPTKGESPAHKNFPDQLALKTVINRALKILIASSDDSVLFETREGQRPIVLEIPAEEEAVPAIVEAAVVSIEAAPEAEPSSNEAKKDPF